MKIKKELIKKDILSYETIDRWMEDFQSNYKNWIKIGDYETSEEMRKVYIESVNKGMAIVVNHFAGTWSLYKKKDNPGKVTIKKVFDKVTDIDPRLKIAKKVIKVKEDFF